jgi:hypothetical protein
VQIDSVEERPKHVIIEMIVTVSGEPSCVDFKMRRPDTSGKNATQQTGEALLWEPPSVEARSVSRRCRRFGDPSGSTTEPRLEGLPSRPCAPG